MYHVVKVFMLISALIHMHQNPIQYAYEHPHIYQNPVFSKGLLFFIHPVVHKSKLRR